MGSTMKPPIQLRKMEGIFLNPGAPPYERRAASELARYLKKITGKKFSVKRAGGKLPERAILIGWGPAAEKFFPEIPASDLGSEEIIIQTSGGRLLVAGGRPRGTLYAVSRFLQDFCGVRWWTSWAEKVPRNSGLAIPKIRVRAKPAFEMRDPYWFPAFDPLWAMRNLSNGMNSRIPEDMGGHVIPHPIGCAHTFRILVPPGEHFEKHPEWFSLVQGERRSQRAQLCLTHPGLRQFAAERTLEFLRQGPRECRTISVSPNDWFGACECENCRAFDQAEGSPAGTLLDFVNFVAEKVEKEFPHILVDTLAYRYTRKPPKTVRARPNVMVKLCSFECNFREPLDHPSNASFAEHIQAWSKVCSKLFVWDYTPNFAHFLLPHPNWFTLGPNLRFFKSHGVMGMFEQGVQECHGAEMGELKAWLLARLLWNPFQDDRALIKEFLEGYYGPAAPLIMSYFELIYKASEGYSLTCFNGYDNLDVPFLHFKYLSQAEHLWREAEKSVKRKADFLRRVRVARRSIGYAWLLRWDALEKECRETEGGWPHPESKAEYAAKWLKQTAGEKRFAWTQVSRTAEGGPTPTPELFVAAVNEGKALTW